MRLWSIHPSHLDAKGLVALWREGLLARAVLLGKTRGYRSHPQLERFRRCRDPVAAIDGYLRHVLLESRARGYRFDESKIGRASSSPRRPVRAGQLAYEWRHLLSKLRVRDPSLWRRQRRGSPTCHPSFRVVPGELEAWERVGRAKRSG
jgi:Pyrimidine dimer DNA glycosylase